MIFLICTLVLLSTLEIFLFFIHLPPLEVKGNIVKEYYSAAELSQTPLVLDSMPRIETGENELRAFDDEWDHNKKLPRTWHLVPDDKEISMNQVDSNTCIEDRYGNVNCLPSLMIIGFESCSTTTINNWFEKHPNIVNNWRESRFFDSIPTIKSLQNTLFDYWKGQPRIPGGINGMGKYWTLEKSPGYATHSHTPEFVKEMLPNVRILALTRNPTARAYSMFLMFTYHYNLDRSFFPGSHFVKNMVTGDVIYTNEFGVGGKTMPATVSPTDEEWKYLSYPPDPKDFDTWIRKEVQKPKDIKLGETNSRTDRLLYGGCYSYYLKKWAKYFPSNQLIVIPSELFFTDDASASMEKLQNGLGLPLLDYSTVLTKQRNGRLDVPSISQFLNSVMNSYSAKSLPMLDSTKEILDQFYCEQNIELSRMLGGRRLPGYSCAEEGVSIL